MVIGAVACLVTGTGCVQYQAHVLQPPQIEAKLRARSLGADGLAEFVRVQVGKPEFAWPPATLEPETLTAIAWFFSNDLEVARAKAETAVAAIITARQRINPSISGEGGRNKTPDSIATYAISPSFIIETAGKRGLRILQAEKNAEAARIGVYETAWGVRTRVRNALASYAVALTKLDSAQTEDKLRGEVFGILQKRLELGEAARPELNQALTEKAAATGALRSAEGDVNRAFAEIAGAVGLPIAVVEKVPVTVSAFSAVESVATEQAQGAGLQHRADIRRALVAYEEVDARLRLAIANQYPNISLNPGFTYQEGFPSYTLGSLLESLPILHKNQGPIAEQEAARKQAEAEFIALQARVLAEAETSVVRYRTASAEWNAARETLQKVGQEKLLATGTAFQRGDASRLDLTTASLDTMGLRKVQDDAFEKLQAALGALEDAMQTPVWAAIPAPDLQTSKRAEKKK